MSNYEVNPNKEYFLAGDVSGSMQELDPACGDKSKYVYMLEKFEMFIRAAEEYDKHGETTIMLFGDKVVTYQDVKLDDIKAKLRRPDFQGYTMTDLVIQEAYKLHKRKQREDKDHPGSHLLIFTDGEATNKVSVKRVLVDIAEDVRSEDEFQITFLTVGTSNRSLDKFLDDLHEAVEEASDKDIVHVDRLEDVDFLSSVSGKMRHNEDRPERV